MRMQNAACAEQENIFLKQQITQKNNRIRILEELLAAMKR